MTEVNDKNAINCNWTILCFNHYFKSTFYTQNITEKLLNTKKNVYKICTQFGIITSCLCMNISEIIKVECGEVLQINNQHLVKRSNQQC